MGAGLLYVLKLQKIFKKIVNLGGTNPQNARPLLGLHAGTLLGSAGSPRSIPVFIYRVSETSRHTNADLDTVQFQVLK